MTRRVRWTERALKAAAKLDRPTRERITQKVELFAATGHGDVERLKGELAGLYRLRVGDWRVFFSEEEGQLLLVRAVRPRSGAY